MPNNFHTLTENAYPKTKYLTLNHKVYQQEAQDTYSLEFPQPDLQDENCHQW